MRRALVGLVLLLAGAVAAVAGLFRLGWRRHGAPMTELSFLHLDWVRNPSLPQWRAHVENLSSVAVGVLAAVVGVLLMVTAFRSMTRRSEEVR